VTVPIRVDTETFSEQFDFSGFAHRLLLNQSGVGTLPGDQGPLDWLERALPLLSASPFEARLTRAIAECLTAPEPLARREALRFFEKFPHVEGAERVVELARGDRRLFAGVPDPDGSVDLEWSLLRVVGARMMVGDDEAKNVARAESLRPGGRPEPLIAALTAQDTDWVLSNVERIVSLHPTTGSTILFRLERVGIDPVAVGMRIAPLAAAGDPNFRADVKKYIRDTNARARIISASLRGRTPNKT
jgi:hypothetical protein